MTDFALVPAGRSNPQPLWARIWRVGIAQSPMTPSQGRIVFFILAIVAMTMPFFFVDIPPLTDLPRHMAQYKIAEDLHSSQFLGKFYDFHWELVGNLGVDLGVHFLAPLFGIERATWLIVAAIPPLMAAGMLLLAREVHGRILSTTLFALPLAYGFPFQFGFVNFTLSIALMFVGLGVWLRLERLGALKLRTALFIPFGFVLFVTHSVGWGLFGLALLAIEFEKERMSGAQAALAIVRAVRSCLPLAPSILAMALWWVGGTAGAPIEWDPIIKIVYLLKLFCNDRRSFDLVSVGILYALLTCASRIGLRVERRLSIAALLLLGAFILAPGQMIGAYYADMRIAPAMMAMGLLALDPTGLSARARAGIAIAGLLFAITHIADQTATFIRLNREYRTELAAIDHISFGARIFALAETGCGQAWHAARIEHLPALATVRRDAFVNGMWEMPSSKLLTVHYAPAGRFAFDPTGLVLPADCPLPGSLSFAQSLKAFPRSAFDYVWLLDIPHALWPNDPDLKPIWHSDRSILYRISRSSGNPAP